MWSISGLGLPVEVSNGQVALLTASNNKLPGNAHVGHLLLQRFTAKVLPIDRVKVEGVFILWQQKNTSIHFEDVETLDKTKFQYTHF